jgi:beta-lactamase regulating signal transducer with metallopeptidase domain
METISRCLITFLINALWQIPLVAAVAVLACRLIRNGPAAHRHAMWIAALVAAVLLPLASVKPAKPGADLRYAFSSTPQSGWGPAPAAVQRAVPVERRAPAKHARTVPFARTTAAVVLAAYALFLLFRFAKLGRAWMQMTQIRHSAEPWAIPPLVERVWSRCLDVFGLSNVDLLASGRISTPVTAGSAVILPEALFAETSEDVLTTAIGHEMAHIARHDFACNLFYELLYLPVAIHPAAAAIRRRIERTRELACDELVTRCLMDTAAYARSILSIAADVNRLPRPACTLGVFDGDFLEERIKRLVERPAVNLRHARLLLAAGLSALALCAVIASGLAVSARAQSGIRGEMKLGGEAYNRGDFKTAVQHFESAVKLDPSDTGAKLFLANALMREFFVEHAPDGSPLMASARQQYLDVLANDHRNQQAIRGMMAVAMDTQRFAEAHDWVLKLIQADPKDKTAYYTAGVLDWALVFPEYQRANEAAGGKREEYFIPDAEARKRLREQYLPHIEDGFRMLQIALDLDPKYGDAMAYMNLLYRLKAGMSDRPEEASALIAKADDWVGKTLAVNGGKGRGEASATRQLDVDGPPPGPASPNSFVAAPPPPPPPPPPPGGSTTAPHEPADGGSLHERPPAR